MIEFIFWSLYSSSVSNYAEVACLQGAARTQQKPVNIFIPANSLQVLISDSGSAFCSATRRLNVNDV